MSDDIGDEFDGDEDESSEFEEMFGYAPTTGVVSTRDLNAFADDQLAQARPDRYHSPDKEWQTPVIDKVAELVSGRKRKQLAREVATRIVSNREAVATRKSQDVLRTFYVDGAGMLPLEWGDGKDWMRQFTHILHLPLALPGRMRVRFGGMNVQDWADWIDENEKRLKATILAGEQALGGARYIATLMRDQNVQRTDELRRPPKGGK